MLRRCCFSKERALSSVLGSWRNAVLLAAAPGFWSRLLEEEDRFNVLDLDLDLGGETMTGPPSFRLKESQSCGKREE